MVAEGGFGKVASSTTGYFPNCSTSRQNSAGDWQTLDWARGFSADTNMVAGVPAQVRRRCGPALAARFHENMP